MNFTPYLITGIVATVLLLFTAIAIKKARPYGIVVAFLQPLCMFAAMRTDELYATMDLSGANDIVDMLIGDLTAVLMQSFPWMLLMVAVYAFNMVYAIAINKQKGRGFAIAATVLTILQCFLVTPIERSARMIAGSIGEGHGVIGVVFHVIFLLPMLLLAVQGVMNLLSKGEPAPAAAPAPAEEPAQDQAE